MLDDDQLADSWVVANRDMNRARTLTGRDGYTRALGTDVLDRLLVAPAHWLDLCCGQGKALLEAAALLRDHGVAGRITGVDLIPPATAVAVEVQFVTASVATWQPSDRFDLITCVHGLHYVGDKLGLLARAASWLTPSGQLSANFDATSIRLPDGEPAGRRQTMALRAAGFTYDSRTHRIHRHSSATVEFPFRYLGADDRAGPNYTGQPAVHSYYEPA